MEPKPKKRLDQVCDAIRLKNYAYSTAKTYVDWLLAEETLAETVLSNGGIALGLTKRGY